MITKIKIKLFDQYKGDIDSWARNNSKKEQLVMTDGDWYLINALLQDIFLVKKGLASEEFVESLNIKLIENCDSDETIAQLMKLEN